jgi:hypothetical protein
LTHFGHGDAAQDRAAALAEQLAKFDPEREEETRTEIAGGFGDLVSDGRTKENYPTLMFRMSLSLPLARKFVKAAIPSLFAVRLHVDRTI